MNWLKGKQAERLKEERAESQRKTRPAEDQSDRQQDR